MKALSLGKVLRKIHRDEVGAVSLETVLIIGAIAHADPDLPDQGGVAGNPRVSSIKGVQNLEDLAPEGEFLEAIGRRLMIGAVLLFASWRFPRQPTLPTRSTIGIRIRGPWPRGF